MIKRLRIESVNFTGDKDNYGNPKSIVKVWGDDGFYVSSSKKIGDCVNQEVDLEVKEYTSAKGKVYYRLSFPQTQVTDKPNERPGRNDDLIVRQVAFKGLIELVAAGKMEVEDIMETNVSMYANMIKAATQEMSESIPTEVREQQYLTLDDIPF